MPAERYLIAGLDAIARAYGPGANVGDGFAVGHLGASLLSGWFMIQDGTVDAEVDDVIRPQVDRAWMGSPPFAARPEEPAAPEELGRLLSALSPAVGTSDHAGHQVIFSSLALRAFRTLPATLTRSRIDGLCHLAAAYVPPRQPDIGDGEAPPEPAALARDALVGFADAVKSYQGFGQGYSGHVLTFGCAVLDLLALGHVGVGRRALSGYRDYLATCRLGPGGPFTTSARPPHAPSIMHPEHLGYWRSHAVDHAVQGLGHFTKYTYAFLRLERLVSDAGVRERARASLHDVLEW
jgi:hypothetical protein